MLFRRVFDVFTVVLLVGMITLVVLIKTDVVLDADKKKDKTLKNQVNHYRKYYDMDDSKYWNDEQFRDDVERITSSREVPKGEQVMKDSTCLIIGLCKNSEPIISKTFDRLEKIGTYFKETQYLFYENDSYDDTRRILTEWKDADPKHRMCIFEDKPKLPNERLLRMQVLRQKCHDYYMKELKTRFRPDYVIIYDTDLVGGPFLPGLLFAMSLDNWDVQWANGFSYHRLHDFRNVLPDHKRGKKITYDYLAIELLNGEASCNWATQTDKCKDMHDLRAIDIDRNPVNLRSAFGGMGIYKIDAFESGNYIDENGEDICEHIVFHRNLHKNGFNRMFIQPKMILVR